ncbi:MAG: PKD domain-containing protein [Chitinophagaceae bacterium]
MKKLFYFLGLLWCCAYLLPLSAKAEPDCSANFTFSISNRTVSFQSVAGLPAGTTHWWTFGDATNSGEANPVHTYANPGAYWVTHYIYNQASNCRDTVVKAITLDSTNCNIQPKFEWRRDSANCRKINFINQSTPISPNVHFIWKFGDGSSSNDVNPSHVYANDGVYTVCLVIETNNGCRKEFCQQVEVRCQTTCNLEARFEFRKDSINPLKIFFINQTVIPASGAQYLWTFGDGSQSTDRNPVHVYASPGTYTVCLKVMVSNTCVSSVCKTIVLTNNCNLQIDFSWRFDSVQRNKVYFKSLVSPLTTAAVFYKWTFGDGTISNEPNPVHVYQQPGAYKVCLVVETANCRREICKEILIQVPPPPPPCNVTAKFESWIDSSKWFKVWFRNFSQPIQNIWKTSWSYGDGTSSQDFNSFHEYQQPGKYYVCLKVQSLSGCISTYCDSVIVRRNDSCENRSDYSFQISTGNPLEYRFKPKYLNAAWQYLWTFGDGTSSTAMAPAHKFPQRGIYKVCLKVVTANNCATTTCKEIRVGLDGREIISNNIPVYPNPARNVVKLEVQVDASTTLQLRVLDATGVQKMEFRTPAMAGNNYIGIPVEKLNNGFYIVEIRYANQVKLAKFQKAD